MFSRGFGGNRNFALAMDLDSVVITIDDNMRLCSYGLDFFLLNCDFFVANILMFESVI